ncbi:uncharacterized protein PHALS_06341 [Plasmopara halstedii]|uniref:Uncharacterized protein n=1 Tax=Plasmopara halstedii TaxID=4781 RepID=A0A0N7L804_PLAHL|nr:uncharacterized protein PHALS_06341 [Plasmopara halstedii]CEG48523.1 hypothetical protein PHALS_06341 [Plasmopara halstedii]|eukprot:XP_024584892.1 hypothetical protein PHALS_06341 [Plasmopara halstedii]
MRCRGRQKELPHKKEILHREFDSDKKPGEKMSLSLIFSALEQGIVAFLTAHKNMCLSQYLREKLLV